MLIESQAFVPLLRRPGDRGSIGCRPGRPLTRPTCHISEGVVTVVDFHQLHTSVQRASDRLKKLDAANQSVRP
jgi:hypothetical protein